MREFIINENDSDQRVDKFILKTMKTMPKSLMYKYIRNKKIKVNRKRCEISQRLVVGDTMQCFISEEFFEDTKELTFLKVPSALTILYEDENILLVDKAKGLLAHSDEAGVQDNLADRLLHYLYNKKEYDPAQEQSFTPALCHRIDRNTQGIVIAAKNAMALREMNAHIKKREVKKLYHCIVQGIPSKKEAHITLYHKKLEGNKADVKAHYCEGYKAMESVYRMLDHTKTLSLIEVELLSGKSHQIRAMMAYLGHPLLGDVKYGANRDGLHTYQALCAYSVGFNFPLDAKLGYLNGKVFILQTCGVDERFQEYRRQR